MAKRLEAWPVAGISDVRAMAGSTREVAQRTGLSVEFVAGCRRDREPAPEHPLRCACGGLRERSDHPVCRDCSNQARRSVRPAQARVLRAQGFSDDQIAGQLGVTPRVVGSLVAQARRHR